MVHVQDTGIWRGLCSGDRDREWFMYRRKGVKGGVYVQETG